MIEEEKAKKKKETEEESFSFSDVFDYVMFFRVALPANIETVENDNAREDIQNAIENTLRICAKKYPDIKLKYNLGYYGKEEIEIPISV